MRKLNSGDLLVWFLDDLHFIKLPLACMGHSAGGDPRLVAGYKILKPFDLCLLALTSPLLLGLLDLVHPFEIFIITGISGGVPPSRLYMTLTTELRNSRSWGYKDKCVFIFTEEPGQPEYMGMVQIVGRLVPGSVWMDFQAGV